MSHRHGSKQERTQRRGSGRHEGGSSAGRQYRDPAAGDWRGSGEQPHEAHGPQGRASSDVWAGPAPFEDASGPEPGWDERDARTRAHSDAGEYERAGYGHRGGHRHGERGRPFASQGGWSSGGYTDHAYSGPAYGGTARGHGSGMLANMGPMSGYPHQIAAGATFDRWAPSGGEHAYGHHGAYSGTPEPYAERGFGGHGDRELRRGGGFRGHGPKGYTRADERILDDVCDRLCQDDDVDASEVEVAVSGGEVTLQGTVPERSMRRRAEDLAEDVLGVQYVQNNLRVTRR